MVFGTFRIALANALRGLAERIARCEECGEPLQGSRCVNLAECENAHADASRAARGETLKARQAPQAWRGSGAID